MEYRHRVYHGVHEEGGTNTNDCELSRTGTTFRNYQEHARQKG